MRRHDEPPDESLAGERRVNELWQITRDWDRRDDEPPVEGVARERLVGEPLDKSLARERSDDEFAMEWSNGIGESITSFIVNETFFTGGITM